MPLIKLMHLQSLAEMLQKREAALCSHRLTPVLESFVFPLEGGLTIDMLCIFFEEKTF